MIDLFGFYCFIFRWFILAKPWRSPSCFHLRNNLNPKNYEQCFRICTGETIRMHYRDVPRHFPLGGGVGHLTIYPTTVTNKKVIEDNIATNSCSMANFWQSFLQFQAYWGNVMPPTPQQTHHWLQAMLDKHFMLHKSLQSTPNGG